MAEPVGDLVVDLSLDAARFDEQMARVRRHFSGTESDAKKTAAVVEQSMNRQALAAQKAGISVGQYKAAMRMLPAQFTDVATQLAGGQSPWLILLQQGGQVKDSFGGMIPMFWGLAGAITAALFLNEFVDDVPWGHVDIAATMEVERDDVWRSTGSTGFGARLLAEFAVAFEAPKKD